MPWRERLHLIGELRLPGARSVALPGPAGLVAIGTEGGRVFLRHLPGGAGPPALDVGPPVDALIASADGRLTAVSEGVAVRAWSVRTPDAPERADPAAPPPAPPDALVESLEREVDALSVALAADAGWAVAGCASGMVVVRALDDGRTARCAGHRTEVLDVAMAPDGSRACSCGTDGVVRAWGPEPVPGVPTPDEDPESILDRAPPDHLPYVARIRTAPAETLPGLAGEVVSRSAKGAVLLRAFLQDASARVRYRTLWLLGVDEVWGFTHELAEALHDANESVRRAAVGAIDALDEVACTDELSALCERERDPTVRALAERVLERFIG